MRRRCIVAPFVVKLIPRNKVVASFYEPKSMQDDPTFIINLVRCIIGNRRVAIRQ